jgi:hypothetical protein
MVHRYRLAALAALVTALVLGLTGPATAAPGDPDGGNGNLQAQLTAANQAFLDAKAALDASQVRQAAMQAKLQQTEQRLAAMKVTAVQLATAAYRNSGLRTVAAMLGSASTENFVDRATAMNSMARHSQKQLREYADLQREQANEKAALDTEVIRQQAQLAEMDKRKNDAQKALTAHGGGQDASGPGAPTGLVKSAAPAPRNSDGSWPKESCSVDDPTTTGCITPRLLHAYQETKAAGFDHYVSCYRSQQDGGEHPKGRACDWAANKGGFVDARATGSDKAYGDNLAAFYLKNATALAVLYVIWYDRIWQTSTGNWKTYTSGDGSPAGDHYNHVHLSVN